MTEKEFTDRLSSLRESKGVSARDMSLSIGQNQGYINNIESGRALPSMSTFFYICEYLNISEAEFFSTDNPHPVELRAIIKELKKLNKDQLTHILAIIEYMVRVK